MPEAAIFLLISLLLFLLITDTVTVKFIYDGKKRIEIDFMLFGVSFTESRSKRSTFSRKKRKRDKMLFDHIMHLLSNSVVRVKELCVFIDGSDPMKYALQRAAFHSLISVILAYVDSNSKFSSADDIIVGISDNNKTVFRADIRAQVSLWNFTVCLISYLTSKSKNGKTEESNV